MSPVEGVVAVLMFAAIFLTLRYSIAVGTFLSWLPSRRLDDEHWPDVDPGEFEEFKAAWNESIAGAKEIARLDPREQFAVWRVLKTARREHLG